MNGNQLTMMIKPASSACNLDCDYCFYQDLAKSREVSCYPFMSEEVVQAIIAKSLKETLVCSFVFQGGEPSLVGLAFYQKFVALVDFHKSKEHIIHYAFQTNGMYLDADWALFFKKHQFLVGVSFDGSPQLHDQHRFDHAKQGSARSVLKGIAVLKEYEVDFNILCVVTDVLAQNVPLLFTFLTGHGFRFLQFIPCLERFADSPEKPFLSSTSYAAFLKQLFDFWYEQWLKGAPVSIRLFDNLVSMLAGYPPESCDMSGMCSIQYVSESEGSVYPCDFYCLDEFLLGNILLDEFSTLDMNRAKLHFLETSSNTVDACSSCSWKDLCRGGCKRFRDETGYRFCSSFQSFFPYAIARLEQVAHTMIR